MNNHMGERPASERKPWVKPGSELRSWKTPVLTPVLNFEETAKTAGTETVGNGASLSS